MKKTVVLWTMICILCIGAPAMAEDEPMLEKGAKELGLSGNIDLEGTQGGVDVVLDASYGYFIARDLEIGPIISFSRTNDGDILSYGVGAFVDYHIVGASMVGFARTVPYVGASLELTALDTDLGEDQNALALTPKVGIKWFLRSYLAIDTHFYFSLATDDIYVNDNELDSYDYGFNLGLRVYFQ